MGFILKDKVLMLKKGYPTVSDKYDILPACIDSAETGEISVGAPVVRGSETGRYKAITTSSAVANIAGFVLASNIKVPSTFPAPLDQQKYKKDEAFNLCNKGYMAVEITLGDGTTKTIADVVEGAQVAIFLGATTNALGKLTVKGAKDTATTAVTATDLTGAKFTGVVENHGTTASPVWFAEIVFDI